MGQICNLPPPELALVFTVTLGETASYVDEEHPIDAGFPCK